MAACQEWTERSQNRYEIIAHLDDIGCRPNKHWFLLNDTTVRTDRLMTLVQIPPDCVALDEMPASECPKGVLMELLASLQHPYIYPVLDLGVFYSNQTHYACLVMPFNSRGSLKDLIYKVSLALLVFSVKTKFSLFLRSSRSGMRRGTESILENPHAYLYRKFNVWDDKFLKHFYFYVNEAFRHTDICIAGTLYYRTELQGTIKSFQREK